MDAPDADEAETDDAADESDADDAEAAGDTDGDMKPVDETKAESPVVTEQPEPTKQGGRVRRWFRRNR
ncbi:hypothetical protein [Mycolicibacterium porcinum]|uniref:Uncharacterized protein n=1 Tax=Mycolicibacterium porcinum TaxID=39693 RepID=A0AAW5T7S1_9MYCO|nr:hypothetical protein [Mycolicibacterium porcinum]MCV7390328.1 hypothetical protein [Mycolicibacterium porcinum]